jgi:hypothetical protein
MKPVQLGYAVLGLVLGVSVAAQQSSAQKAEAKDMTLLGHDELQARSAYQPVIQRQGDRWIAYVGHHGGNAMNPLTGKEEPNGTSIVDVTNPKSPRYLAHIPGQPVGGSMPNMPGMSESGGAQMVRVCSGSELPRADKSKTYLLRSYGNTAGSGHEVWDVTDPAKPTRVTVVVSGLTGTHKNWWECDTGIAYLVSGDPAWRVPRMTKIYDLSDPAKPVFIRDFGLVGQEPGSVGTPPGDNGLHGPVSTGPKGNRVYFGIGYRVDGVVQIVDREKLLKGPKDPTPENLLYPQIARVDLPPSVGAHNVFPLLGMEIAAFAKHPDKIRDFLLVVDEHTGRECASEPQALAYFFDITTESRPLGVSSFGVSEASGNYCERGARRFGMHSSQENFTPIYYKRVMFFAHFNAGVRAVDIRDPFHPKEIAYFVPAATPRTTGGGIQTNNLEVDDRGYIYLADRNGAGLHIVELSGEARKVANFSGT